MTVATARVDGARMHSVACWQRRVILLLLLSLPLAFLPPLILLLLPVYVWFGIVFARATGMRFPVLWGLGCVVPYLGLLLLYLINQKATRQLNGAGYVVGFLGARPPAGVHFTGPANDDRRMPVPPPVRGPNSSGGAAAGPPPAAMYFLVIDDQRSGPLTLEQVRRLWVDGRVTRATFTWRSGLVAWVEAQSVPELRHLFTYDVG